MSDKTGEREHHKFSPSNWGKWLNHCPKFQSGEVGPAAHRGTLMHDEWQKKHLAKCSTNSTTNK
jgi:hypothetical protein